MIVSKKKNFFSVCFLLIKVTENEMKDFSLLSRND